MYMDVRKIFFLIILPIVHDDNLFVLQFTEILMPLFPKSITTT